MVIERTAGLIAALGGSGSDRDASGVARSLNAQQPADRVADALVAALEGCKERTRGGAVPWTAGTAAGATFAAVGGSFGLFALSDAYQLGWSVLPFLPLLAIVIIAGSLFAAAVAGKRQRGESSEDVSVVIALKLMAAGVDEDTARTAAEYVSGIRSDAFSFRQIAARRSIARYGVGAAAILATAVFWIGYFLAIGEAAVRGM